MERPAVVIDLLTLLIALLTKRLPTPPQSNLFPLSSRLGTSGVGWGETRVERAWPDGASQEEQCGNRATVRLGIDQPSLLTGEVCRHDLLFHHISGGLRSIR